MTESAAQELGRELRDLYDAAGRPTLKSLVHQARRQTPQVNLTTTTLSDWLNGKTVPSSASAVRFLAVYLQPLAFKNGEGWYIVRPAAWWEQLRARAWKERHANRGGRRAAHPAQPDRGGTRSPSTQLGPSPPPGHESIAFAHINVVPDRTPRWKEYRHYSHLCSFDGACGRYFRLVEFVYGADLWLDVTVLNPSRIPAVLTAVGVKILDVMQVDHPCGRGYPDASKISPPTDEYTLDMPDLRKLVALGPTMVGDGPGVDFDQVPVSVNQDIHVRLQDPVYLPGGAPYRYVLRFKNYQRNLPSQVRIRLLANVEESFATSEILEISST